MTLVAAAIDEHFTKFLGLMKAFYYAEQNERPAYLNKSFQALIAEPETAEKIGQFEVDRLKEMHDELEEKSRGMISEQAEHKNPSMEDFEQFGQMAANFLGRLRRFENDLSKDEVGIDILTGLRTQQVLYEDVRRELTRINRSQEYFGAAMIRIDWYKDMKADLKREELDEVLRSASGAIRKTMRLYDDAYRLPEGKFMIALKHTDSSGAMSALERFQRIVDDFNDEQLEINDMLADKGFKLTISCALTELVDGGEIDKLLHGLGGLLSEHEDEESLILEYHPRSELEMFASSNSF